MAANEHDTYNKKMPHRPILEFIPIFSVLDSQRIFRRLSTSCQLGSTLLSRVTSHLRPVNRNRDDRLGRRFRTASSPSDPTDWTRAAYGKNSTGSTLRRRAR